VVGFLNVGRLSQGPAVRLTDRRHPLRLVSRLGGSLTVGSGEDGVGVLGPDERFAALVPAGDEPADRVGEVADRVEGRGGRPDG